MKGLVRPWRVRHWRRPTAKRVDRRLLCAFLGLFLLALTTTAPALDHRDLTFHVSFDRGLEADVAGGDKSVKVESDVALVPDHAAEPEIGREAAGAFLLYLPPY